jgi:small subunit ribosomal protein S15
LEISIIISTFAPDKKKKEKIPESIKFFEMPYLTIEKKANIFAEFGGKATNTGSIEGQVALLTERISQISKHLQVNKKDHSTQRGLMQMVGQRKRLLTYLQKNNLQGYRALIEKLGLRK